MRIALAAALVLPPLLAAAGGAARAQDFEAPPPLPACANLDRVDGQSRIAVDSGYVPSGDERPLGAADVTSVLVDVSAQYVGPAGFGGYAIVPMSYGKIASSSFERSDTSFGNVELCGRLPYAPRLSREVSIAALRPDAIHLRSSRIDDYIEAYRYRGVLDPDRLHGGRRGRVSPRRSLPRSDGRASATSCDPYLACGPWRASAARRQHSERPDRASSARSSPASRSTTTG